MASDERKPRRIAAYTLLGDPAWLATSIDSYASMIDTLLVSHDENLKSWAGQDLSEGILAGRSIVEEAAARHGIELVYAIADFAAHDGDLSKAETFQRQTCLDALADTADWVLQFDGDEILQNPSFLEYAIGQAERHQRDALLISFRSIRAHVRGSWFIEESTRRWRYWDAVPGPIAVRPTATLKYHRQTVDEPYRMLVRREADERMDPSDAILHFSWVRAVSDIERKAQISAHSGDFDWDPRINQWKELSDRPFRGLVKATFFPIERNGRGFRPARLAPEFDRALVKHETEWRLRA